MVKEYADHLEFKQYRTSRLWLKVNGTGEMIQILADN